MPMSAHVLAVQTTANAGWAKAPSHGAPSGMRSWPGRIFIFYSLHASGPALGECETSVQRAATV
jgi:hypothetical protein